MTYFLEHKIEYNSKVIPPEMLTEKGNIMDPTDCFFNDICFSCSTDNSEVVLSDRRKDLFMDYEFCEEE